jgi:transcriptional regulator of acetoin/glycerol metabolism
MKYIWTGNIRELQHVIEHAFITCNHSVIANKDLPIEFQTPAINNDTKTDDNEYNVIIQALEKTHWNKSNAAKLLGISRRNLYNKINQYNINTNPL